MSCPNRLKDLREDRDKNQCEIAAIINVHQTTLSKYENGTSDIPTVILCRLADYYSTSTDYILMRTAQIAPYPKAL